MLALIIDDDKFCRESLGYLLEKYCPDIEVLAMFSDPGVAAKEIPKYHPDLIFLDVEMPGMTGFELLQRCEVRDFMVIMMSSSDEYGLQAVKFDALDYLMKPLVKEDLLHSVCKAKNLKAQSKSAFVESNALVGLKRCSKRMALPTIDGLIIIDTNNILYSESVNNYTRFYLTNGSDVLISKTLKRVEELLAEEIDFVRMHHSYIINLSHLNQYKREGAGGQVVMSNGKMLPVSRSKKKELLDKVVRL